MLKNYMEVFVLKRLPEVLKLHPDCCSCPQCIEDISNYSLNHLPVKYFSSEKGKHFTSLYADDPENNALIIQRINEAIEIVKKNPRHSFKDVGD